MRYIGQKLYFELCDQNTATPSVLKVKEIE